MKVKSLMSRLFVRFPGPGPVAVAASLFAAFSAANQASAAPVEALNFTGGVPFFSDTGNPLVNFNVGYQFTVNTPITVTSLGYFDAGASGLVESHPVGLYSGGTLLTSATVVSGDPLVASTATQPGNGFRYHDITGVTLSPGTYSVAGLIGTVSTGDDFYTKSTATSTPSEITYVQGFYSSGPTLAHAPDQITDRPLSNFGGSFQYVVAPEPASLGLIGFGGLLLVRRRKAYSA